MNIVYITSTFPFGPGEAFLIPELTDLARRGHRLVVAPLNPVGPIVHSLTDWRANLVRKSIVSPSGVLSCARELLISPDLRRFFVNLIDGSRTPSTASRNLVSAAKGVWLGRYLQSQQVDHIHCHWAGCSATMAWVASIVADVPWSFTAHRWDIVANNMFCQKAQHASFVRFISKSGKRLAEEVGFRRTEKAKVIHMGISLPSANNRVNSLRHGSPVVLCPANLLPVKGHAHLIKALAIVRKRGANCQLWLAGDGPLRASIEHQVRSLGLDHLVRFLGAIDHARLLGLYEDGHVSLVVLPSIDLGGGTHEGIPVSLMEAMSFRVPVISTPTGGIPELVREGEGVLVSPGDPEALAGAIEMLLSDPMRSDAIGEAGHRRVIEDFSAERVGDQLCESFHINRRIDQVGSHPVNICVSDRPKT